MKTQPTTIQDLEDHYDFEFPDDFRNLYGNLSAAECWKKTSEFSILSPAEMLRRKEGVADPDLLPIIKTKHGDAFCYRMPWTRKGNDGGWLLYDHETNDVGSLGRHVIGMTRAVVLEAEYRRIWNATVSHDKRTEAELATFARSLLNEIPVLAAGMDTILRTKQTDMLMFGLEKHPDVLGTSLLPEEVRVPFYLAMQAEREWSNGDNEAAVRTWQSAVEADPDSGAIRWALGSALAVSGDAEGAVRCFAAVVEGNWCTNRPACLYQQGPWTANAKWAAAYLAKLGDIYQRVNRSPLICKLVLDGEMANPVRWQQILQADLDAGDWKRARTIAMSGIAENNWHGGRLLPWCYQALCDVYQHMHMTQRVTHLKAELGGPPHRFHDLEFLQLSVCGGVM